MAHANQIAEISHVLLASYEERREATKAMANMEEEQDQVLAELEAAKANKAFEVKAVVKAS